MTDKITENQRSSEDLIPVSLEEITLNLKHIIDGDVPVFRKKSDGDFVTIPADRLEQFIGETSSDPLNLMMEKNWKSKIEELKEKTPRGKAPENTSDHTAPKIKTSLEVLKQYGNVSGQMGKFQLMSIVDREEILDVSIEKLHGLNEKKGLLDLAAIIKMVEVVANTYYVNYAELENNLDSENLRNNIFGIFSKTEWVLKLVIEILRNNGKRYENYRILDEIATGSYTIDSMCKGVILFTGFCLFYNDYIDNGMATKKLRGEFKEKYLRYYNKRLNMNMLTLEKIIKGGLRRIESEKEQLQYVTGALLYDIGKLPVINYHDSDDPYDESAVKMHALIGYNMIMKMQKYPFPVLAMAAFHHEYYGEKSGYHFTNPVINKITHKKRSDEKAYYFITYDEKEFMEGTALAFFPCKMIEITDIFNALVNRRKHSPFEALKMMKKNFITLSFKIDPLLFDIFLDFMQACNIINENDRREIDTIIY